MIIIQRPHRSGKTTILLHYMVVNPQSIYVTRTDEGAVNAFCTSQRLNLGISKDRFKGMAHIAGLSKLGHTILIDDLDYILERHFKMGLELAQIAHVATIVEEKE